MMTELIGGNPGNVRQCEPIPKIRKVVDDSKAMALRQGKKVVKRKKARQNKILVTPNFDTSSESEFAGFDSGNDKSLDTKTTLLSQEMFYPKSPEGSEHLNWNTMVGALQVIFKEELDRQLEHTTSEMARLKEHISKENSQVRLEISNDISQVKNEISENMAQVRGEMLINKNEISEDIAQVRGEMLINKKEISGDIAQVKGKVSLEISGVQKEMCQIREQVIQQVQKCDTQIELINSVHQTMSIITENVQALKTEVDCNAVSTSEHFALVGERMEDLETQVQEKFKSMAVSLGENSDHIQEAMSTLQEVKTFANTAYNLALTTKIEVIRKYNFPQVVDNSGVGLNPLTQEFEVRMPKIESQFNGGSIKSKGHDKGDSDYSSTSGGGTSLSDHDSLCSIKSRGSGRKRHPRRFRLTGTMMVSEKPKFDGDNKSAADFVEEVTMYKKRFDISSHELLEMFPSFLTGRARDWWGVIKTKVIYWTQLKKKIMSHFFDKFELEKIKKKWYRLHFKEGDDIETFTLEALKLRRLLNAKESMAVKTERIILKLPAHLRDYLLCRRFRDEEQLLRHIKEAMRLKGEDSYGVNKSAYTNNNNSKFGNFKNRPNTGTNFVQNNNSNSGPSRPYNNQANTLVDQINRSHVGDNQNINGQARPRKISYIWFRGKKFKSVCNLQAYMARRAGDGQVGVEGTTTHSLSSVPSSPTHSIQGNS